MKASWNRDGRRNGRGHYCVSGCRVRQPGGQAGVIKASPTVPLARDAYGVRFSRPCASVRKPYGVSWQSQQLQQGAHSRLIMGGLLISA